MSKHYLQNKLTGTQGQVVGFDANGNAIAQAPPETGYSKAETLTAATAALYGLTSAAVPDDVLAWLGKYNTYAWEKYAITAVPIESYAATTVTQSGAARTIQYSNSIEKNGSTISLKNPQSITVQNSLSSAQALAALAPCFVTNLYGDPSGIYHIPTGATSGNVTNTWTYTVSYSTSLNQVGLGGAQELKTRKVSDVVYQYELVDYVFSENRSTYPDDGEQDGFRYKFSGIPFENAASVHTKIETGSYVGTGTYGASNPNSLTFEKPPKLVHIYYGGSNTTGTESWYMVADFDPNIVYGTRTHPVNANGGTREQKVQWSNGGKTLSWYNTQSAAYQMNAANVKFYYYAIY